MPTIDAPSTRALRSSRSSSPVQSLEPIEPLTQQELSLVCTVVREKLMLKPGNHPVMKVEATFRRKDDSGAGRQTLFGKVRKEDLELWAVWEDKPSKEYPFPHPELDYYAVQVIDDSPPESSSASSSNPSTSSSNPTQVALH